MALRDEELAEDTDLERLMRENQDLRGALAHLEGMLRHGEQQAALHEQARGKAEAEIDAAVAAARRNAAILGAARRSRVFRYTRLPSALRREPDRRSQLTWPIIGVVECRPPCPSPP